MLSVALSSARWPDTFSSTIRWRDMEEHWTAAAVGYEERAGCEGETIPPDLVPYIWLLVVTEGIRKLSSSER